MVGALGLAVRVIRIRGKAETKSCGITFAAAGIKLDQARGPSQQQNEYSGGERVQCADVADLTKSSEMADGVDNVVRRFALRFVDDQGAVKRRGLWLARHALLNFHYRVTKNEGSVAFAAMFAAPGRITGHPYFIDRQNPFPTYGAAGLSFFISLSN